MGCYDMSGVPNQAWNELTTTVTGLLRHEVQYYFAIGDWMTKYLPKSGYQKHYAFACHVAIEINNRTGDDRVALYYADAWKAALLSREERNLFLKPGYTVTNVRDYVHIRKEGRSDIFEEIRHLTPPVRIRNRSKKQVATPHLLRPTAAPQRYHDNGIPEAELDPAPQRGILVKVKNDRGEFDAEMVATAFTNLVSVIPLDCLSEAWPDVICVVEQKLRATKGKRGMIVSKDNDGFPDLTRLAL